MKIVNHGTWSDYTPSPYPSYLPPGVTFAKSDTSGQDWYAAIGYSPTTGAPGCESIFTSGSVLVTAHNINGKWITQAAQTDFSKIFPIGMLLLEVQGYAGSNPLTDLGLGGIYDAASNTIIAKAQRDKVAL